MPYERTQKIGERFEQAITLIKDASYNARQLSQVIGVSRPTVHRIIVDLRRRGYVIRAVGCLSRHVGAVVTDEKGFVLGIGWNDVPLGQVPCSLRTAEQLLNNPDDKQTFSEYERSERFRSHIKSRNLGNQPFCFKDELALLEGEKRAEFTRAVHAEENALLQAAKHDLMSVIGSVLFTTDSPCTLCAKKAYQLGVQQIVYVEDYPGISVQQTLRTGKNPVRLHRFEGATGSGYYDLLTTLIPDKEMNALYL